MAPIPRVAVLLAEGFEELEAIAVIDVLRRASVGVTVAAVTGPGRTVVGSHRIAVTADALLADLHAADLSMVVLDRKSTRLNSSHS